MDWKIGDKVRLTGKQWKHIFRLADEQVIVGVEGGDQVQFEGDPTYWKVYRNWEIELVERKEEKMTVKLSDVNVGDRVKLTRKNGDEAVFTVMSASPRTLETDHNVYMVEGGDTLEIVERAFKPVPGLYSNKVTHDRFILSTTGEKFFTVATGRWIRSSAYEHEATREENGWKREITF